MGRRVGKLLVVVVAFGGGVALLVSAWLSVEDKLPGLIGGADPRMTDPLEFWIRPGVTAAFGLILLIFGFYIANKPLPRWTGNKSTISGERVHTRSESWLRRHGLKVEAEVIAIGPTMNGNRRLGWEVTARGMGPQKQKVYTFRSAPMNFDPSPHIAKGDSIPVIVDPDNPREYWVDTTGISKDA